MKHLLPAALLVGAAFPSAAGPSANTETPVFVNAIEVHPWAEGRVYRVRTSPGAITDIALEPGEALIAVASGDTARWIIGDTESGSESTRRTHILVKPVSAGLATNLVITTDRRVYHLQLTSGGPAAIALSWTYPAGTLISLKGKPGTERPQAAETARPAFDVETLCFGYTISGDAAPWRPVRAFDDGQRTYVEFPDTIATREAPPFFITGSDQAPALVNYRMRGRFYIIDRLFEQAELRLGQKKQKIVRITWTRGDRAQVCK
ncbi:P-type conjugative transfer protein TrbG [Sphingosinicella microcystinivorans]|uniref:P-type conjugative transfer protein TrbG n=1 Tax=Sphingosinicella microcystinivorans TaxID=335406 RepID=UPI0022F3CFD7|nr:P-type conjugative transfer protein TrbG [Sphingosinicella microcystinivorans]WBX83826.1 P-type conjugative transfer protein TrbG [Sphingosinicella microcystinivorans]